MTCPRCVDQHIIDPYFLEEAKATFAQLGVDLVIFIKEHKIKRADLPILAKVAETIRIIEVL